MTGRIYSFDPIMILSQVLHGGHFRLGSNPYEA
jgi:hypothetical protein